MRKQARSIVLVFLSLIGAAILGFAAMVGSGSSIAATTALIMGGTGRPDPVDFPGYMPNVTNYYIIPHSACTVSDCNQVSVFTPETLWPIYGGFSALTWKQSVLQGVEDLDSVAVQPRLGTLGPDNRLVIFGYSQSGAIVAFEKQRLAEQLTPEEQQYVEWVIIGDVSRPNGGLNGRVLGRGLPILEFPFGPSVPTDTDMATTDIAFKWDIIADAPLYVTNPLGMLNAILGFQYVHGTYPDPTQASPDSSPGGYSPEEWEDMMANPEDYPDIIDIQYYGDTKYLTVTPKVLPLVMPLHQIGLKPLADLMEPALRVIIEETAYDRSLNPGQPQRFRLIPIFNPLTLTVHVIEAIPQGVNQMLDGLKETEEPVTTTSVTDSGETPAAGTESKSTTLTNKLTAVVNDKLDAVRHTDVVEDTTTPTDPPATKSEDETTPAGTGGSTPAKDDTTASDGDNKKADNDDKADNSISNKVDTLKKKVDTVKKRFTPKKQDTEKKDADSSTGSDSSNAAA